MGAGVVPGDRGQVSEDGALLAERWPERQIGALEPLHRRSRISPHRFGREQLGAGFDPRGRSSQARAQRLLEADHGRQREGPPPAERFLERRQADLRLVGQPLARQPPPRKLLAHEQSDAFGAFDAQFAMHGIAPAAPGHIRTFPHISSMPVNRRLNRRQEMRALPAISGTFPWRRAAPAGT